MDQVMDKVLKLYREGFVICGFNGITTLLNAKGEEKKNCSSVGKWDHLTYANCRETWKESNNGWFIKTGAISKLTVIDVDDPHVYEQLCESNPELKSFRTIKTNHGYHIYCKYDQSIKTNSNTTTKIDIRNDRAIVFCSPCQYQLLDKSWVIYTDLGGSVQPIPENIKDLVNPPTIIPKPKDSNTAITSPKKIIKLKDSIITMKQHILSQKLIKLVKNDDLSYEDWIIVGLMLHNIDVNLKQEWIDFSKKYKEYDENETINSWNGFKFDPEGLKIGSLHRLARMDDPEQYYTIEGSYGPFDERNDGHMDGHIDGYYLKTLTITIPDKKDPTKNLVIPDKMRIVEYLNKFLMFVNIGKPFVIELKDTTPLGYIFHHKVDMKYDTFAPIAKFYESWLFSQKRHTVNQVTFIPFLKDPPAQIDLAFNLFRGFKHTKNGFNADFKIDMDLINPWIDMVKHNWCNDEDILFNYIIGWFAYKIQHPAEKIGASIVITSLLEGVGKNTFFDFFNHHVIGSEFGILTGSIDELISKFNDQFETKLIICCDELKNNGNQFAHTDELKKLMTQKTRNVEAKYMSSRSNCPDYSDYVFFTNNWGVIKPSMSDRRFCCIEANVDRANDHEYWATIYANNTDKVGEHFFYYLANMDLTQFNPRDIPMTEWKRDLKDFSLDPIVKSVINYIRNDTKKAAFHPIASLFEEYTKIMSGKISTNSRGFSSNLCKILQLETGRGMSEGEQKRGFAVSIEILKKCICKILKDPDYSFNPETSDNVF